jgi:hypothetical protein
VAEVDEEVDEEVYVGAIRPKAQDTVSQCWKDSKEEYRHKHGGVRTCGSHFPVLVLSLVSSEV